MKTALIAFIALVFGIGVGTTTAPEPEPQPEPTPRIITIEIPGPQPTPRVEIREVPTTLSEACELAILDLWTLATDLSDVLTDIESDYFDYPDENLTDFGRRVEARIIQAQDDFSGYEIPSTAENCYD